MKNLLFGLLIIIAFLLTSCVPVPIQAPIPATPTPTPTPIVTFDCPSIVDTETWCLGDGSQIVFKTDDYEGIKTLNIVVFAENVDVLQQSMLFAEEYAGLKPATSVEVSFPEGLRLAGSPGVWEINTEINNIWATRMVEIPVVN